MLFPIQSHRINWFGDAGSDPNVELKCQSARSTSYTQLTFYLANSPGIRIARNISPAVSAAQSSCERVAVLPEIGTYRLSIQKIGTNRISILPEIGMTNRRLSWQRLATYRLGYIYIRNPDHFVDTCLPSDPLCDYFTLDETYDVVRTKCRYLCNGCVRSLSSCREKNKAVYYF